jgi:hypothetical protein
MSIRKTLALGFTLVVLAFPYLACSSSTSSSSADTPCAKAVNAICTKACECGDSMRCRVGTTSVSDAGVVANGSIGFKTLEDCKALYAFSCGDIKDMIDWTACGKDLETAVCAGQESKFVALPSTCQAKQ